MDGKKAKKGGLLSSIINIPICALLIGFVSIVLYGNQIIANLPTDSKFNLSSFVGYLPSNQSGVQNGVIYYRLANGTVIEPLAILLHVVIYVAAITLVLSIVCIVKRKSIITKVASGVLALVTLAAISLFIYTYAMNIDGILWAEINNFFASVFSMGILGGVQSTSFGSFAVFTTYLLICALGLSSFLVTLSNK